MWDGVFLLLTLSGVMAAASFLAGSLPLSFKLSPSQLRLTTSIGTGVLVGTALIVIIPEGIETLYSASSSLHTASDARPKGTRAEDPHHSEQHAHAAEKHSPHAWIGLVLILGYILMYLIDTLPSVSGSASALPARRPLHISLSDLSQGLHDASSRSPSAQHSPPLLPSGNDPDNAVPPHSNSTTIGLVIHATADGIALGASTSSSAARTRLGLVVFLAIMLHKAPAAFGLTSVLLKQGLNKRAARARLLVFSLAAPVGAITTWALVHLLGGRVHGGPESEAEGMWWTGVVLVFSGGTFLYVAMHSMQSSSQHAHESDNLPSLDGYASVEGSRAREKAGTTLSECVVVVLGMLLPLLTQIGHAHAHGD